MKKQYSTLEEAYEDYEKNYKPLGYFWVGKKPRKKKKGKLTRQRSKAND